MDTNTDPNRKHIVSFIIFSKCLVKVMEVYMTSVLSTVGLNLNTDIFGVLYTDSGIVLYPHCGCWFLKFLNFSI